MLFTIFAASRRSRIHFLTAADVRKSIDKTEGHDEPVSSEPILLANVSGPILERVIEWCRQHKDDPPFANENFKQRCTNGVSDWDHKFFEVRFFFIVFTI